MYSIHMLGRNSCKINLRWLLKQLYMHVWCMYIQVFENTFVLYSINLIITMVCHGSISTKCSGSLRHSLINNYSGIQWLNFKKNSGGIVTLINGRMGGRNAWGGTQTPLQCPAQEKVSNKGLCKLPVWQVLGDDLLKVPLTLIMSCYRLPKAV